MKRTIKEDGFFPSSHERFEAEVLPQLEQFPDNNAKIGFLRRLIINYEADHPQTDELRETFGSYRGEYHASCKRELKRYEELAKLETEEKRIRTRQKIDAQKAVTPKIETEEADPLGKQGQLTVVQCVRVLHVLLQAMWGDGNQPTQGDEAAAIAALTGYSWDKIRKRLISPAQTTNAKTTEDVEEAQRILRLAGLPELASQLEGEKKPVEKK